MLLDTMVFRSCSELQLRNTLPYLPLPVAAACCCCLLLPAACCFCLLPVAGCLLLLPVAGCLLLPVQGGEGGGVGVVRRGGAGGGAGAGDGAGGGSEREGEGEEGMRRMRSRRGTTNVNWGLSHQQMSGSSVDRGGRPGRGECHLLIGSDLRGPGGGSH